MENATEKIVENIIEKVEKAAIKRAAKIMVEKSATETIKEINKRAFDGVRKKVTEEFGETFLKENARRIGGMQGVGTRAAKGLGKNAGIVFTVCFVAKDIADGKPKKAVASVAGTLASAGATALAVGLIANPFGLFVLAVGAGVAAGMAVESIIGED